MNIDPKTLKKENPLILFNSNFISLTLISLLLLQTTALFSQDNCDDYEDGNIANFENVIAFTGLNNGDGLGYDVSNIGDFNGDGIEDISFSATYATTVNNQNEIIEESGQIYVVFAEEGSDYSNVDLNQLGQINGLKGFRIPGPNSFDRFGYGGGKGIGDINGDGFDDLIISSPYPDPNVPDDFEPPSNNVANGFASGVSHIIFGKPNMPAVLDVNMLNGSNGFSITGTHYYENVGTHAGSAGDFNNDGLDDFYVTADDSSISGESVGALFLIYGKRSAYQASYIAHQFGTEDALVIVGENSANNSSTGGGDNLGITAAPLNDINGDGISDLLIGASHANNNFGAGYVIFGSNNNIKGAVDTTVNYQHFSSRPNYTMYELHQENTFKILNVAKLDGTNGFEINGSTNNGGLGNTTGDAGDLNNDGINDLLIGGYLESSTGACYIIYGQPNGNFNVDANGDINVNNITTTTGLKIYGEKPIDFFGYSANSIGDFNGDFIEDIAIGAIFTDSPGKSNAGSVYIIYGQDGGFANATLNVSTLNSTNKGFRLDGETEKAWLGFSVDGLVDLNGDSYKEIIVGSEFGRVPDTPNPQSRPPGKAYVLSSKCITCARLVTRLTDDYIECGDDDGATIVIEVGNPKNIELEGKELLFWINNPLYSDRFYHNEFNGYYYFEGLPAFESNLIDNNCDIKLDFTIEKEECLRINANSIDNTFNHLVYPNPTTDVLNFYFTVFQENVSIMVYDIYGNEIINEELKLKKYIETQSLAKGSYIYRIVNQENDLIGNGQFIKL